MTKQKMIREMRKIHDLVNGKTKRDTFDVLNEVEHIALNVLTGTRDTRAVKSKSKLMGA